MKLFYSAASPYVRKVLVVAHETGLADRIEFLDAAANPVKRDAAIVRHNPLGKVPTMLVDGETALYDSRVIAEYVDAQHDGQRMFPAEGEARWAALTLQALADGLLDAALLVRYETMMRPKEFVWSDWVDGQMAKIDSAFDEMEKTWAGHLETRLDIGTIAVASAIGYLGLRFADHDWRSGHPRVSAWYDSFCERPSMQATQPKG